MSKLRTHPLRAAMTDEEWHQLGKDVQYGRVSWPIGVEMAEETIQQRTARQFAELERRFYMTARDGDKFHVLRVEESIIAVCATQSDAWKVAAALNNANEGKQCAAHK